MITKEIPIQGRKINVRKVREDILKKYEKYMKFRSNLQFDSITRHEMISSFMEINEFESKKEEVTTYYQK